MSPPLPPCPSIPGGELINPFLDSFLPSGVTNGDDDANVLFLRGNLHVRVIRAADLPDTDR